MVLQPTPKPGVLVIDDDHGVRRSLARVLSRAGYEVETAENGLVATHLLERREWDAVVCDMVMPVMDGWGLYNWLREWHPEILQRLMFVTAWRHEPWVHRFLDHAGCPALSKPFDLSELIDAVRALHLKPARRDDEYRAP